MSQPGGTQPLNAHFQQQQQPLLCNDQLMVTAGNYGYQPYKYGEYPMVGGMQPQLRPAQGGYETGYGMVGNVYPSANKKYMLSPPIANQHFEKQQQGMVIAGVPQQVHQLGYQQPAPAYIAATPPQRIMGYVNQQSPPRMMGYMNQVGYSAAAAIVQQQAPPQMYNVPKQANMYQSYVGSGQSQWIIDGSTGMPQPMAVGFAPDGGSMVNQTYNMTVYAQQEPGRVYQSDVNVAHRPVLLPNNLHSPAAVVMNNMATRQPFQPYQQESQQFCVQQPDGAFSPCVNVAAASPVYRGTVMQHSDGATYDGRQQCISTMAGPTRPNTVACLTTCVSSASASLPSTQQCLYSNLQYGAPNTLGVDNHAVAHYSLPPHQGAYGNDAGGGNVPKMSPGLCEQNMSSAVTLSVVSNSVVVTQSAMQRAVATTTTFTLPTNQTAASGGHGGGGMSCCQGNHHMGAIGADDQAFTALRQSLPPRYKCPNSGLTADQVALGARNTVPLSHMNQWNSVDSPCVGNVDSPGNSISVPFGWKRIIEGGIVVYYSPSQARITSPNQMCQYLLMDGTCKCGLECPLLLDRVFHFDPSRPSKPWSPADIKYADDVTKLCSHKRKIIAMATFQNTTSMQKLRRQSETSQAPASQITPQKRLGRKLKSSGRKRRKKAPAVTSPYDGMFVSQLLSCRDKLLEKTLPPLNTPQDALMPTPELEALLSETTMKKAGASPCALTEHRPANKDSMCEENRGGPTEVQSDMRSRLKGSAFMQTNLGNPFVMECDRDASQKFGFSSPQQQQRAPFPGCEKFGQAPVAFAPQVRMNSMPVGPHGYRYAAPCQQAEQCGGETNAIYAVRHPNAMMSGHVTTALPMVMNSAVMPMRPEPPGCVASGQRFMMRTLRPPGGLSYQQADFNQRGLGGLHSFHQRGPYWPYMRRKATEKDCQPRSYNSVFSGRAPCPNVDVRQMWQSQNMAGRVAGAGDVFHNNHNTTVSGHESSDLRKALHSPAADEPTTQDNKSSMDATQVASMQPSAVVSPPKCAESHPPGSNVVTPSPSIKRERCSSSVRHSDSSPDTSASQSPNCQSRDVSPIVAGHPGCKPCDGDTDCGALNKGSTADSNSNTSFTDVGRHSNSVAVHTQPVLSSSDFPASSLLSAAARGHSAVSSIPSDPQSVASEMQPQLASCVNQSQLPVSSVESSPVPSVQSLQAPPVQSLQAPSVHAPSVHAPPVHAPPVQSLSESPTIVPSAASRMQSDGMPAVNGELPEQSPIQMVQNMISGLEATQNQLAMIAMCKKTTSRRRRSAFSADLCCPVGLPEGTMHRYSGAPDYAVDNVMASTGEFVDASIYTALVPTGVSGSGMPPLSVGTVTAVTNAITQLIPSTQPPMLHQEQSMKPGMLQEMQAGSEAHLGVLMSLAQQVVNQQVVVPQQPSLDQVIGQQVMMGQPPMMHVVNGIGAPVVNPVMMINQLGGSGDSLPTHPVMLTSVTPMVMAGYNEVPQDITKETDAVTLDRQQVAEQLTCGRTSEDPPCEDTAELCGDGPTDVTASELKRGHKSKRLVRRKGKRKDRCKKSSTPTIASMLQAANTPAVALQQQQQQLMQLAAATPSQPVHLSLPMLSPQLLQQTAANYGPGLVNDVQLGQLLTAQQLQVGGLACPPTGDVVQPMDCGAALQNFTMPNVELLMKQLSATAQNPMASAQILQSWAQNLQGQNTLLLKNLQSLQQQHQDLLCGATSTGDTLTTSNSPTYRYNGDTIQARNPVLASALAQGVCGTPTIDSAGSATSSAHQVESPDRNGAAERSRSVTACNSDDDAPSCVDHACSAAVDSGSEGKTIVAEDHNSDTSDAESSTHVAGEAVSASLTDSGGFAMNSIPNPMNLTAAVSAVMNGQQLDAYPSETVASGTGRSRPMRHIRTNRFRAHGRTIRRRHRLDMHNNALLRKRSFTAVNNTGVKGNHESTPCDEKAGVAQTPTALDLTMPSGGGYSSGTVTDNHDAMRTCDSTEAAVLTNTTESANLDVMDSPHVQTQRLSTDDCFSASMQEGTCTSDTAENAGGSFSGDDSRNAESCRRGSDTEMLHGYHQETVESLDSTQEKNMETSAGCHDDNVWAAGSCQEDDSGISASCQGDRLDGCLGNKSSAQDAREKTYSEVLDGTPKSNASAFSASSTDVSNGCYDSDQDEPINLSNDRMTTSVAVDVSSTQTHESESSPWKDADVTSVADDDGDEVAGTPSATAPSSGYDDSSDDCPISDWRNNVLAGNGPLQGVIKENGDGRLDDVYAESDKVDTGFVSREAKLLMIDRQTESPSPSTENEDEMVDACSSPRTFNTGDLVWGPIRGYPSWPGKVVHDSDVRGHHHESEDGKLWVRWFGDHTFTQVEPAKLKTLSEGLDAQHRETKKHRKGRRMNSTLESAIQEAMMELDKPDSDASVSPILNHMTITSVTTSISCASTEAATIVKTGKTKIGKKQKCR